jgi:putative SOS response-associated peptidase YedK
MLGVSERRGERILDVYRWGLVPSWTVDPTAVRSTFNARAETLAKRSMFRQAFQNQRILVPADAFYEWETLGPKVKQPYAFRRADGRPIVFAGLREWWRDAEGHELRTATIITTEAGPDMPIHDRQPVVLEENTWDQWLDRRITDPALLEPLLVPTQRGTLTRHPVSRNVGNVRNDGPELLEAVALEEEPVQTSLQLMGVEVDP